MARPRTTCPGDEELEELGKEMVQWVIENNPVHLSRWYSIKKGILYNCWKAMIQKESFLPYYEQALLLIGYQYLLKDSVINPSISQRWQRIYFKDLRDEEDETAKYNASLKQPSEATVSVEVLSQLLNKSPPLVKQENNNT